MPCTTSASTTEAQHAVNLKKLTEAYFLLHMLNRTALDSQGRVSAVYTLSAVGVLSVVLSMSRHLLRAWGELGIA